MSFAFNKTRFCVGFIVALWEGRRQAVSFLDIAEFTSGHISARWFVRIVTRENTTGVWLKEPTAEKREKDTQHAVLRHMKGRFMTMANEKILMVTMSVTDMAKAKAFYAEQLGWSVTHRLRSKAISTGSLFRSQEEVPR